MHLFKKYLPYGLSLLLILALILSVTLYRELKSTELASSLQEKELLEKIEYAEETIASRDGRIAELEILLGDTENSLKKTVVEKENLAENLEDEKDRNDAFENQIDKIGSKVGVLDKLAKTDKELLMKYSKVYFLNEHYMPKKLTEIPDDFTYHTDGDPEFINAQVYPFLIDLFEAAKEDGVKLWTLSAFRSFDEQRALKGSYTVSYGSGANAFSADQGYSEHQLGTTLDFTTENLGGGLNGFEATPAYAWLEKNAYKYGFVLSYPKGNAYYVFEPWHWRFVGTDLAEDLHRDGKSFYDLEQREIDTYLIKLFN